MRAGWAQNLARWRHLGNVPCVSLQSVRHHRNVVYCSWRVRLAQLGAHQLIRCNVTFNRDGKAFLPFEARELVRRIGLQRQEVREPSPEQSRKKRSCISREWCATLVVSSWFATPLATHHSGPSRGGVWASIRERPSSSHRLTCWGTHRAGVWVGRG